MKVVFELDGSSRAWDPVFSIMITKMWSMCGNPAWLATARAPPLPEAATGRANATTAATQAPASTIAPS